MYFLIIFLYFDARLSALVAASRKRTQETEVFFGAISMFLCMNLKVSEETHENFLLLIRSEFSCSLLTGFSKTPHMFCRRGKCNRNGVVKLHYKSAIPCDVIQAENAAAVQELKPFCLKQSDGSQQELNKLHIEEHTYVCYLFRPDKLAREQCV
jgi:hypothetical protein